jgi:hypothetical protein
MSRTFQFWSSSFRYEFSQHKPSMSSFNNLCQRNKHDSLFETQFGDMILAKLLETMVVLPASVQDMLCEQLTCACGPEEDSTMDDSAAVHDAQEEYPSNQEIQQFQHLLDGVQRFISMRLRNKPTPDTTPNRDHAVVSATKCLAAFCKYTKFVKSVYGVGTAILPSHYRSIE